MSFRQYGGLQFSSKNNYNNLINLTSQSDLPKTLGILNTTIDVLSTINQTDLTTLTYNVLNRTNIKGVSSYGLPILTTIDTNSNKGIALYPNAGYGAFNPAVSNGDNEIVATATSINTETLVVGTNQTVWNGLKIIPTKGTTLGTTTIGQGGEASFTTSFSCNGTNSIINGPAIFSSTTPPVSNQDIPDPDDSSNSIPTTAWVQGAIDYYISGGTPDGSLTLNELTVNDLSTFNGSVTLNDGVVIKNSNGNFTSLYQDSTTFNIKCNYNSSQISIQTNNSTGNSFENLRLENGNNIFNGDVTLNNNLKIYNGTNYTTFDMDASNNLTITNEVNSQNVGIYAKNGSGITDTYLTVSSATGLRGVGNGLAFTAQNSGSGLQYGIIYMGVASANAYNTLVQANDCAVVGTSTTGQNNGALTLTTQSNTSNSNGIRITQPTITMTGNNIQLNANTQVSSSTTQPAYDDSSNSIPTTAWVKGAINYYGGGNITYTYTIGGTNQSVAVPTGAKFVKIICIGAGGGGGGGGYGSDGAAIVSGGGGGGGGGISIVNVALLNETSFNINVGSGGLGGILKTIVVGSPPATSGGNGGDSYVYTTLNNIQWYYAYAYGGSGGVVGGTVNNVQPAGGSGGYGNQGVGGAGGNGCGTTSSITGNALPGGPSNGFLLTGINGNTSTQLGAGGGGGGGASVSSGYSSYGADGGGIGNIGYNLIQGNGTGSITIYGQPSISTTVPATGPDGVGGGGGGGSSGYRLAPGQTSATIYPATNGVYGGGGGGAGNSTYPTISGKTSTAGKGGDGVVILEFTS